MSSSKPTSILIVFSYQCRRLDRSTFWGVGKVVDVSPIRGPFSVGQEMRNRDLIFRLAPKSDWAELRRWSVDVANAQLTLPQR
jgi:hypothetical protein